MHCLPAPPKTLLSAADYAKILEAAVTPAHRLLFELSWELSESFTLLLRLRACDLYLDFHHRTPKDLLWLPQRGKPYLLREVRSSQALDLALRSFSPPDRYWLFPSRIQPDRHLSSRAASRALGRAAKRAGIPHVVSPRVLKLSAFSHWRSLGESSEGLADRSGLSLAAVRRNLEKTMALQANLSQI